VGNLLAAGSKFGAAEVGDLGAALKNTSATARGANVSIESTVAALEVMSQNFLKGGEAGTGLRNVMSILQSEGKKLADAGIRDINIESDGLQATLVRLKPLLGDAAALTEIFGRENANAARILIQNADAIGEMETRVTGTNTAVEQAAIRTDTFQNAVDRLMATIQGVGIGVFEEYSDELKGIVELTINAINFLREHSDEVVTVAQVLGTAAAAVAAYNAVVKVQTLVTNAAVIAQRLLNTAMKLNPVGLVIAGLTAVTLLFIKFRDKVADGAAVLLDFAKIAINSFKTLGDLLGIRS
jgi:TP901 family phage tail tape measure protein